MIRIKCPKCATALTLDDEEAGQVGRCTDCGAKFRVPARKAETRPGKNTGKKAGKAANRDRADADEDDDDRDNGDEQAAAKPRTKREKDKSDEVKGQIVTLVTFLVCAILLGIGSVFISRLGFFVIGVSVFLMIACALMVGRSALSDSTLQFLMVLLFTPYFLYYAISNWQRTKQFCIGYIGFLLVLCAAAGGAFLHEGKVEGERKATREVIKKAQTAPPAAVDQKG